MNNTTNPLLFLILVVATTTITVGAQPPLPQQQVAGEGHRGGNNNKIRHIRARYDTQREEIVVGWEWRGSTPVDGKVFYEFSEFIGKLYAYILVFVLYNY
jgi:hypothetical protein